MTWNNFVVKTMGFLVFMILAMNFIEWGEKTQPIVTNCLLVFLWVCMIRDFCVWVWSKVK